MSRTIVFALFVEHTRKAVITQTTLGGAHWGHVVSSTSGVHTFDSIKEFQDTIAEHIAKGHEVTVKVVNPN